MTDKKRMHWMPLDWPAYWADTRGFDAERHGAYLNLLGELWMRKGVLSATDPDLCGLAACTPDRWAIVGPSVLAKFTVVDGMLTQKRLGAEFDHAQVVSAKRRAAGKEGAAKRWQRDGKPMANGMANGKQSDGQEQKQKQSPNGDSIGPAPAAPVPPPPPPPPAPPSAPPAVAERGGRLPKDWVIPPDWIEVAEQMRPDLNPMATADAFRDYWVAKSGKDATKLDWLATWRTWLRNQRGPRGFVAQTRADQRAATTSGLGTQPQQQGARDVGTDRESVIDVHARVIPDPE